MQPVARRFNIVNHSGLNMVMVTFSVSLFALGTRKAATQKRIFYVSSYYPHIINERFFIPLFVLAFLVYTLQRVWRSSALVVQA